MSMMRYIVSKITKITTEFSKWLRRWNRFWKKKDTFQLVTRISLSCNQSIRTWQTLLCVVVVVVVNFCLICNVFHDCFCYAWIFNKINQINLNYIFGNLLCCWSYVIKAAKTKMVDTDKTLITNVPKIHEDTKNKVLILLFKRTCI